MADVALRRGGDVGGILPGGGTAVVTVAAAAEYFGMIDAHHGIPAAGAMAGRAVVTGVYMLRTLAGGGAAVVT